MSAHHERFADLHARAVAHIAQLLGLVDGEPNRFFAEHMFAGFGGFDGPRHVQVIGHRIVDHIDLAVGEQLFIRAVGFGNAERARGALGFGQLTRSDSGDLRVHALLHGGNDFIDGDPGYPENAPANFWHVKKALSSLY